MATAQSIITDALTDIAVLAPGRGPSTSESNAALNILNQMLDEWSGQRLFAYSMNFSSYTLVANLNPHTIGPGAVGIVNTLGTAVTWISVLIQRANLILNSASPNVRVPINIRDDEWWADVRVRQLFTSLPTDLYYQALWPNGNINLWPIPNISYGIELETWQSIISPLALIDTISLPPGYARAIRLSLAVACCPAFRKKVTPDLDWQARKARDTIRVQNPQANRIATQDAGMPISGKVKPYFNYLTGGFGQ